MFKSYFSDIISFWYYYAFDSEKGITAKTSFPPIQTDEIVEVGIGQISVTVNN